MRFIFLNAVEANKYCALLPTPKAASYLSPSWAEGVAVPVLCCCCGVIQCCAFSLTPTLWETGVTSMWELVADACAKSWLPHVSSQPGWCMAGTGLWPCSPAPGPPRSCFGCYWVLLFQSLYSKGVLLCLLWWKGGDWNQVYGLKELKYFFSTAPSTQGTWHNLWSHWHRSCPSCASGKFCVVHSITKYFVNLNKCEMGLIPHLAVKGLFKERSFLLLAPYKAVFVWLRIWLNNFIWCPEDWNSLVWDKTKLKYPFV